MPIAQRGSRGAAAPRTPSRTPSRPRLGVLATHPIQYQAPLYQELARRGAVDLDVAYLSHAGAVPVRDPGFGVTLAWDIDLLGGYRSTELTRRPLAGKVAWLASASMRMAWSMSLTSPRTSGWNESPVRSFSLTEEK